MPTYYPVCTLYYLFRGYPLSVRSSLTHIMLPTTCVLLLVEKEGSVYQTTQIAFSWMKSRSLALLSADCCRDCPWGGRSTLASRGRACGWRFWRELVWTKEGRWKLQMKVHPFPSSPRGGGVRIWWIIFLEGTISLGQSRKLYFTIRVTLYFYYFCRVLTKYSLSTLS